MLDKREKRYHHLKSDPCTDEWTSDVKGRHELLTVPIHSFKVIDIYLLSLNIWKVQKVLNFWVMDGISRRKGRGTSICTYTDNQSTLVPLFLFWDTSLIDQKVLISLSFIKSETVDLPETQLMSLEDKIVFSSISVRYLFYPSRHKIILTWTVLRHLPV